ncbi:hypothetical protein TIFTF001_022341 [Ficus carica]|uniref:Uncharacterized protein n=1 Tax=Ficus carica TaxID=3494 RepID=A0AA88DFF7_FICCA|nr:hypothetical protein TIFTF001_022341 [Ficus carica]
MKEHLSSSHKNVAPCNKVPKEVKEEICAYMKNETMAKHFAQRQFDDRVDSGSYFGSASFGDSSPSAPISDRGFKGPLDRYMKNDEKECTRAGPILTSQNPREAHERVCLDIGRTIADLTKRAKVDLQLISFQNKDGFFGLQQAKDTIDKHSPDPLLADDVPSDDEWFVADEGVPLPLSHIN